MDTLAYHLEKHPFESAPDAEFFYLSSIHREILSSLVYAVNFAKGLVLVAGDAGTGKTILVQALLRELGPNVLVTHIERPQKDFSTIMRRLCETLGIAFNEAAQAPESYHHFRSALEKTDLEGKRTALIIDQAHLLSADCLENIRLLSNYESKNRRLIQIILVGRPGVSHSLLKKPSASLGQRIAVNRILKPLDRKETAHYITHRLRVAGKRQKLFDRKAMGLIWKKSGGVPLAVNRICDRALERGHELKSRTIGLGIITDGADTSNSGSMGIDFPAESKRNVKKIAFSAAVISLLMLVPLIGYMTRNEDVKPAGKKLDVAPAASKKAAPQQNDIPAATTAPAGIARPDEITPAATDPPRDRTASENPVQNDFAASAFSDKGPDTGKQAAATRLPATAPVPPVRPAAEKTLPQQPLPEKAVAAPSSCLKEMAGARYGTQNDTIIDLIQSANPSLRDVTQDCDGQPLVFPDFKKTDLIGENSNGIFFIHFASFYNLDPAEKLAETFKPPNATAEIMRVKQGDNQIFRVIAVGYPSRQTAETALDDLQIKYMPFLQKNDTNRKKVLLEILKGIQ